MKLVIEINDNEYMGIKEYPNNITSYPVTIHLYDAVRNGIPLPKGHGRLIDANDLLDRIGLEDNDENREDNVGEIITLEDFDFIPTIIEADKGRK